MPFFSSGKMTEKEETWKEKILSLVTEKNPLLNFGNWYKMARPKPFSENSWAENFFRRLDILEYDEQTNNDQVYNKIRDYQTLHMRNPGIPDIFATSDISIMLTDTTNNPCTPLEMSAFECIEYYGQKRGSVICKDYYDDWLECNNRKKATLRAVTMRAHRHQRFWEYVAGKRDWSSVYLEKPAPGVYLDPCVAPRDRVHNDAP